MITEDYVSYEIAKLLKEKGFDAECDYLYADGELIRARGGACNWNHGETLYADYKNECSAPTLQMATKWLKVNFNIAPVPYATSIGWYFEVFDLTRRSITGCALLYDAIPSKEKTLETFEEACNVAIKYCLENLI